MGKRKCKNWILSHLEYTKHQESPEIFHLWSAISVIAGTLGRKCWIDHGFYLIYPNHYIILVAESGMMRKSTSAKIAIDLYNEVHIDNQVLSKKITPQKLIINMGDAYNTTGDSSVFIFNSELSVLVGRSGPSEMLDILVDMYDCPDKWNNETKGKGVDLLYNVYVNLLSCVPPKDLATMPNIMIDGGFASRTLFIYASPEKNLRPPVSDPKKYFNERVYALKSDLIEDLQKISELRGEFVLTAEAASLYKVLYDKNYYRTDFEPKLVPYQARKGNHLKALSMILSAASRDTAEITVEDIKQADQLLTMAEASMHETFGYMIEPGTSVSTKHTQVFLRALQKLGGTATHSTMLKRMYRYTNKDEIQLIIDTLLESKSIKMTLKPSRSYKLL